MHMRCAWDSRLQHLLQPLLAAMHDLMIGNRYVLQLETFQSGLHKKATLPNHMQDMLHLQGAVAVTIASLTQQLPHVFTSRRQQRV